MYDRTATCSAIRHMYFTCSACSSDMDGVSRDTMVVVEWKDLKYDGITQAIKARMIVDPPIGKLLVGDTTHVKMGRSSGEKLWTAAFKGIEPECESDAEPEASSKNRKPPKTRPKKTAPSKPPLKKAGPVRHFCAIIIIIPQRVSIPMHRYIF